MFRIFMFLTLCVIIEKSHGEDPQEHIKYLTRYGYLETREEGGAPQSFSGDEIVSGLKNAQKFAGIPVTGELDNPTIKMISTPRCGVPDIIGSKLERFVTIGTKWDTKSLAYGFKKYSTKYRPLLLENKFHEACQKWAKPTGLIFTRYFLPELADIRIGFYVGDHGDRYPFDNNTLAHASYPSPGYLTSIHMNDDFKFALTEDPKEEISILSVFMHELGHALGLGHSDIRESVMYPFNNRKIDLHEDDILGIQSLYGKAS